MENCQTVQPRDAGYVAQPTAGLKVHMCASCNHPIAVYGRIAPCLHAFCLACSTCMSECFLCSAPVAQVEVIRHGVSDLFISATTLQAFKSAGSRDGGQGFGFEDWGAAIRARKSMAAR